MPTPYVSEDLFTPEDWDPVGPPAQGYNPAFEKISARDRNKVTAGKNLSGLVGFVLAGNGGADAEGFFGEPLQKKKWWHDYTFERPFLAFSGRGENRLGPREWFGPGMVWIYADKYRTSHRGMGRPDVP